MARLGEIAGDKVTIVRVSFSSIDSPIAINGVAIDEGETIEFKNRLIEEDHFTNVDLPLSNISVGNDQTSFRLQFNVTSLDF